MDRHHTYKAKQEVGTQRYENITYLFKGIRSEAAGCWGLARVVDEKAPPKWKGLAKFDIYDIILTHKHPKFYPPH